MQLNKNKFYISILLFYQVFIMFIVVNAYNPFHGDLSLENYIEKYICKQKKSKWSFMYVHHLKLNKNHKNIKKLNSTFHFNKNHLHCFTAIYSQINKSQLLVNLNSKQFKHTEILVIINLSLSTSNSKNLSFYINILNKLYIECNQCLPFLLLLPSKAQIKTLKHALTFAQLNSTFPLRSVITFLPYQNFTLYLNPVLDGCAQQNNGLFYPQTANDFRRLKTTKCNLNGSKLNVAINEDMSHINLFYDNNNKKYNTKNFINKNKMFGSDVDLLKMLQQKYNFWSRFLYSEQIYSPKYNSQLNSWTGVLGHVYSGNAHFGLCGISVTLDRLKYVDFTIFTQIDSYAPITRYPKLRSRQWLAVEPFSGSVWFFIGVTFAITLITVALLVNLSKTNKKKKLCSFETAEELIRVLLSNSTHILKLSKLENALKWPLAAWILTCLVLTNAYSGLFYSLLALPETETPIDTIEQFLKYITANKHVELISNPYTDQLFLHAKLSENELNYRIGQRFNRTPIRPFITREDLVTHLKAIKEGQAVLFFSRVYYQSWRHNYGLDIGHQAKEGLHAEVMGVAVAKRSPLLPHFNWAIRQMHESGIGQHFVQRSLSRRLPLPTTDAVIKKRLKKQQLPQFSWHSTVYENAPKVDLNTKKRKINQLSLIDLQSVYVLGEIGVCCSVFVFVIEFFKNMFKQKNYFVETYRNKTKNYK